MWIFLALALVPIVEIALFIQVGGLVGLWPTLLIVVLTAILGSQLLRRQGVGAFLALKSSISDLRDPTGPLFDGAMILFSGALLLTPGFLTDATGLILLIPQVRAALYRRIRERITVQSFGAEGMRPGPRPSPHPSPRGKDVIEGEYTPVDPDSVKTGPANSETPWR